MTQGFKNSQGWSGLPSDHVLSFEGPKSFYIRVENDTRCYFASDSDFADELLIGLGVGEMELHLPHAGFLRFETEGRLWLHDNSRAKPRVQTSERVFTTLDRPAQMSPELLALTRLIQRNERARQNDRMEFQNRLESVRLAAQGSTEVVPQELHNTPAEGDVRADASASASDVEEQEDQADSDQA